MSESRPATEIMNNDNTNKDDAPALNDERFVVRLMARMWRTVCADPNRVIRCLLYACGVFMALDLLFLASSVDKHAHYTWENAIWFYAAYGFVSCVLLVLISKHLLRPSVMRDEDYYD